MRQYINIILLVSILVITMIVCGNIYVPLWIRHFLHHVNPPNDLYNPIVVDTFPFWESGFSKKYFLHPKYMDFYEIGVLALENNLSCKERFTGKVRIDFFCKGDKISTHEITSIQSGVYVGKDMTHYKKVSFMNFEIPFQKKHIENLSVDLTVLEVDQNLKKYGNSLQMYIAVSSSP